MSSLVLFIMKFPNTHSMFRDTNKLLTYKIRCYMEWKLLTLFKPVILFLHPLLMFLADVEMKHWLEMG